MPAPATAPFPSHETATSGEAPSYSSPAPPVICLGQQPCGFFPPRYLWAKILTARRLASGQAGARIVLFYHDSDHDPRETQVMLTNLLTGSPTPFNFTYENKLQRKFSPLHAKRIPEDWLLRTLRRLPAYVGPAAVERFAANPERLVADFCLWMYRSMGLLDGIEVVRSSDPAVRRAACPVDDFFVDLPYEGEIVRARHEGGRLFLHAGGEVRIEVPAASWSPEQVSPARDARLAWMQSVVHATVYVTGGGEAGYLRPESAPGLLLQMRDPIDDKDAALTDLP